MAAVTRHEFRADSSDDEDNAHPAAAASGAPARQVQPSHKKRAKLARRPPDSSDDEDTTHPAATDPAAAASGVHARKTHSRSTRTECCSLCSAEKHLERLGQRMRIPRAVPSVCHPSSRPRCSRDGWIGLLARLVLWPKCPKNTACDSAECRISACPQVQPPWSRHACSVS